MIGVVSLSTGRQSTSSTALICTFLARRWSASAFDGSEHNQIFENYGINTLKVWVTTRSDGIILR
jgi:hypothetical protein